MVPFLCQSNARTATKDSPCSTNSKTSLVHVDVESVCTLQVGLLGWCWLLAEVTRGYNKNKIHETHQLLECSNPPSVGSHNAMWGLRDPLWPCSHPVGIIALETWTQRWVHVTHLSPAVVLLGSLGRCSWSWFHSSWSQYSPVPGI